MKKIVVLSGAGISAESGLSTFRDSGGLWEGFDIMDVASPEGWKKNPQLVLDFYNQRRKQALNALPNAGHLALVKLEEKYDVTIVTQNVDNLHEKAGSTNIIHLHGELFKSRSSTYKNLIYDVDGWELKLGDRCAKGSQLRPDIVWFGEMVPLMDVATAKTKEADIFIVVGTSLQVYPAAGLLAYTKKETLKYIIDPKMPDMIKMSNMHLVEKKGSIGLTEVVSQLLQQH